MKETCYGCNICGKVKQQSNHWFLAWTSLDAADLLQTPAPQGIVGCLVLCEWNDAIAALDGVVHLCGQGCLQKMTQRWSTSFSLEAPRTPAGEPA